MQKKTFRFKAYLTHAKKHFFLSIPDTSKKKQHFFSNIPDTSKKIFSSIPYTRIKNLFKHT